ncbi:MAG: hypothetical protein MI724_19740 [Spirochaetales bacterium]|nr:hypothetical protein [Spirochaetales bacterium]
MYCERCGVQLEDDMERCPLCGGTSRVSEEPRVPEYAPSDERPGVPAVRRIAARVLALLSATAVVILLIVDLFFTGGLSWTPPVVTPVVFGTLMGLLPLLSTRWQSVFVVELVLIAIMLVLLDALDDGSLEWFVPVALPILGLTAFLLAGSAALVPRVRGVAKGALILAAAGVLTAGIEITVRLYRDMAIGISWSAVVLVSTLPAAAFLLLLQQTVLRYVDLRRRFYL